MKAREFQIYESKLTLLEVFDNPYPISNTTQIATILTVKFREMYGDKITGLNVYERTDLNSEDYSRDIFVVLRYNRFWEVHHTNYDDLKTPQSGIILGIHNRPNPRFLSTIIKLYWTKVNSGIRIVASPEMMSVYFRIVSSLVNKHNDTYEMSEIDTNYTGLDGIQRYACIVKPIGKKFLTIIKLP